MALFGGGKPDHPMADIKLAKKLISELPAADPAKALDEVTFWLDSVSRTEGFKLDYRFELFDLLDQAAKLHQRKLAQEYLSTDRQDKFRENKLWTTVYEFWKMLGGAYTQCVEQFQSGAGAVRTGDFTQDGSEVSSWIESQVRSTDGTDRTDFFPLNPFYPLTQKVMALVPESDIRIRSSEFRSSVDSSHPTPRAPAADRTARAGSLTQTPSD